MTHLPPRYTPWRNATAPRSARISLEPNIADMGQGSSSEHAHLTSGNSCPFSSLALSSVHFLIILRLGRTDQLTACTTLRAKEFLSARAILLQFGLPFARRYRIWCDVLERGNTMSLSRTSRCIGCRLCRLSNGQLSRGIPLTESSSCYPHV
jgi:hypothetical protein